MAALTERKKREIEALYRKFKEKPSKVFLNIFISTDISRNPRTIKRILNLINSMGDVEYSAYTEGTNNFTATTFWKESDAKNNVKTLTRRIPEEANVPIKAVNIQAKILYPVD